MNRFLRRVPFLFARLFGLSLPVFALSFVLLEVGLRLGGYDPGKFSWFWIGPKDSYYRLDAGRVWALRENSRAEWGGNVYTADGDGFRKNGSGAAGGGERIFFVGDSFIFGHGVNDDETVPAALEKLLRERGMPVSVANAAAQGYSPGQTYVFLRDVILPRFRPRLVIWNIDNSDMNDMQDRSLHLLAGGRLVRVPGWTHGIFIQGFLYRTIGALFPESRALAWMMHSVAEFDPVRRMEKPSNELALEKIRLMIEDIRGRGVEVLVTQNPRQWEVLGMPEHPEFDVPSIRTFFNGLSKAPGHHLDSNALLREEGALLPGGTVVKAPDRRLGDALFLGEQDMNSFGVHHLSALGSKVFAGQVRDYVVGRGLLKDMAPAGAEAAAGKR